MLEVMKTLCTRQNSGRKDSEETLAFRVSIRSFYEKHYRPLLDPAELPMSYTNLVTIFDYLKVKIVTMFNNNIEQRFVEHVERYVKEC